MKKINVAGLQVDAITKKGLLDVILGRILANQKTFIITPYSEFLYGAFRNPELLDVFNSADFSVADGIGIFWAKKFLEIPLTAKSYWGKILQAAWQIKYSLASIVFYPQWIKSALPEKIVGADLVWDLAKLANNNNFSIFLLGGFGNTAELARKKIISQYPNIQISISNKNPGDQSIIADIEKASPDLLFVAYGPIKQEKWIADNLSKINVKLAIGVGGSFDYIAGKKTSPPQIIRYSGFEWLWRLITQPYRLKRIINATFGLSLGLLRYKIFMSFPFRNNVVAIILNKENHILICKRNPKNPWDTKYGFDPSKMLNYWQFPQGGSESGETAEKTALRESKEEVGMDDLSVFKVSEKKHSYLYNNSVRPLFLQHTRCKGQTQTIVYLRFMGANNEVKVDGLEFVNYKWVPIKLLAAEVHEHRLALAKIVQDDLKDLA